MEKIIAAAIKVGDHIFTAPRHYLIFHQKSFQKLPNAKRDHIQGFVTNEGKFLNRKEAYKLASANGQIQERIDSGALFRYHGKNSTMHPTDLFSEDLWDYSERNP